MGDIIDIYFANLQKLFDERDITLKLTPDAKELLATKGYNPIYGARPLKRTIRQLVENPLAKDILAQKFKPGDTITIEAKDDEIVFE